MKTITTALAQGFIRCHDCGCLIKSKVPCPCTVCKTPVPVRRHRNLHLTTALIISSFCLYLPANIFPIMTVTEFGVTARHTIAGGIVVLVQKDMAPIAMLVLVASILVPLMKLLGISLLLLGVRYRWQMNALLLTRMFRVIAFIGRWSMLDIFMISILVGLVKMGGVANVIAGPAATAFAAVVVLTMLAAKSFDPRLIWDHQASHE
jgi:paraquat-inducible protein A